MTLDRRAYLSIALGSFLIMLGAAFVMAARWQKTPRPAAPPAAIPETFDPALAAGTGWPAAPVQPAPAPTPPAPSPSAPEKRNIKFSYRDSRPARVEIVGSFNQWTPQPLAKGENHVWSTSVELGAGEYTYNFLVDGRPVRDPNNPRTAPEGRSLLVIPPSR
jgi:hypothetical protein